LALGMVYFVPLSALGRYVPGPGTSISSLYGSYRDCGMIVFLLFFLVKV
jgi:hypothetical protein